MVSPLAPWPSEGTRVHCCRLGQAKGGVHVPGQGPGVTGALRRHGRASDTGLFGPCCAGAERVLSGTRDLRARGMDTRGTRSLAPGQVPRGAVPKKREEQGSHGRSVSPPQPKRGGTCGAWSTGLAWPGPALSPHDEAAVRAQACAGAAGPCVPPGARMPSWPWPHPVLMSSELNRFS